MSRMRTRTIQGQAWLTYRLWEIKVTDDATVIVAFVPGHFPMAFFKVDISHSVDINHKTLLYNFKILASRSIVKELYGWALKRQSVFRNFLANVKTEVDESAKVIIGKLLELGVNCRTTNVEVERQRRDGKKRKEEQGSFLPSSMAGVKLLERTS